MCNDSFYQVFCAVENLMHRKSPAVVAIDGRCGSGKTFLANRLQQNFSCNVFHMDDYYLPPQRRCKNWEMLPGGNIDIDRFLANVLIPAQSADTVKYRHYRCREGRLCDPVYIPANPLNIIEGTYSHLSVFTPYYDLKIFLTCSEKEQIRRLSFREGSRTDIFKSRWIPMEERYFFDCNVAASSDIIIDTEDFTMDNFS